MSERQSVAVDMAGLKLVVEAIAMDPEVVKVFQRAARGHGFFAQPEHQAHIRMQELRLCIAEGPWRGEPGDINRILWKRVVQHLERPRKISTLAKRLRDDLATGLKRIHAAVMVEGLEAMPTSVSLAAYKFGSVPAILRGANLHLDEAFDRKSEVDPAKVMVVSFQLDVPRGRKFDSAWIWERAEKAINLLAVSFLRRWEETGPVWGLKTGKLGWTWTGTGSKATTHFRNSLWGNTPYTVVPEWLEARERNPMPEDLKAKGLPRFRTRLDGFARLPRGQLRKDFETAYNALGQAVRLMPTPAASVALAWAALDVAYPSDQLGGARKANSIAYCLLLGAAAKGTFSHPVELVNLYSVRNAIVHAGAQPTWNRDGKAAKIVYGHLESLLEYCIVHNFSTRVQLTNALVTPENKEAALAWAVGSRENQEKLRDNSVLPTYKAICQRTIKLWSDVEKILR